MNITDRELLIFCDLTNLKMEYANLLKSIEYEDGRESDTEVHTIYSLLEAEYDGIEDRKGLGMERFSPNKVEPYYDEDDTDEIKNEIIAEAQRLNEERRKQLKLHEKYMNKTFGRFYEIKNNGTKIYSYYEKSELRRTAPYLMEYYDRLQVGGTEGEFLKEWKVVDVFDNYLLGKYDFEENIKKIEKIIKDLKTEKDNEKNEEKEKAFDQIIRALEGEVKNQKFPTRGEIKEIKNKFMTVKTIRFMVSVGLAVLPLDKALDMIEGTNKLLNSKKALKGLFGKAVGNTSIEASKLFSDETAKKMIEILTNLELDFVLPEVIDKKTTSFSQNLGMSLLENQENKSEEKLELGLNYLGLEQKIDLSEDGLICTVLKKGTGEGSEYVLVVKDEKNKGVINEFNEDLRTGLIPPAGLQLAKITEIVKKTYNLKDLIITGGDYGGNIAALLGLIDSKNIVRGFFDKKPMDLSAIVDFTPRDISSTSSENKYMVSSEIVFHSLTGGKIEDGVLQGLDLVMTAAGGILATGLGGVIAAGVFVLFMLCDVLSKYYDQSKYQKKVEELFGLLNRGKIISKYRIFQERTIEHKSGGKVSYEYHDKDIHTQKGVVLGEIAKGYEEKMIPLMYKDLEDETNEIKKQEIAGFDDIGASRVFKKFEDEGANKESISVDLGTYLKIFNLVKINNFGVVKFSENKIILIDKYVRTVYIYEKNADKFTEKKLEAKRYLYSYEKVEGSRGYIGKGYTKKDKYVELRFSPEKQIVSDGNYGTKEIELYPKNKPVEKKAPRKAEASGEAILGEILGEPSVYFIVSDSRGEVSFAGSFMNLMELMYKIQSNFKDKNKYGLTINDKEEKIVELNYSLEKEENNNKVKNDTILKFLVLANEEGKINTGSIYKNLNPNYIATVLRSFMETKIEKGGYSEEDVLKEVTKYMEDKIEYEIITEENYEKFILNELKRDNENKLDYPHFPIIAERMTYGELDKYVAVRENENGEKTLLIGILEGDRYDNKKVGFVYG